MSSFIGTIPNQITERGRKLAQGIWTQSDGSEILIRDMSYEHLINTVTYLRRLDRTLPDELCEELVKRGRQERCELKLPLKSFDPQAASSFCTDGWQALIQDPILTTLVKVREK